MQPKLCYCLINQKPLQKGHETELDDENPNNFVLLWDYANQSIVLQTDVVRNGVRNLFETQ